MSQIKNFPCETAESNGSVTKDVVSACIIIGDEVHPLDGDCPNWISEKLHQRLVAGLNTDVSLRLGGVFQLSLTCYANERHSCDILPIQYTPLQLKIIDMWLEHGLHGCPYEPSSLIEFLSRLESLTKCST